MLGHRAFHFFRFSVQTLSIGYQVLIYLFVSLSFFSVARGAFLKISFPGWKGGSSFASFGLSQDLCGLQMCLLLWGGF